MFITVKFIEDIIFSREMQNTECTYEEWIVWNKHYTFRDVLKVQSRTYAYSTIYGRYEPEAKYAGHTVRHIHKANHFNYILVMEKE